VSRQVVSGALFGPLASTVGSSLAAWMDAGMERSVIGA
jgi:hypothetical protein